MLLSGSNNFIIFCDNFCQCTFPISNLLTYRELIYLVFEGVSCLCLDSGWSILWFYSVPPCRCQGLEICYDHFVDHADLCI
jgi:hypothetical protein